jgi:dTDP-4-amino-4,6-dideoxygalactose transaminase
LNTATGAGSPAKIQLFDLARQNLPIADELMSAVAGIASAQSFVLGATVKQFEESVAEYLGSMHAIGVASGTDAVYLALRVLDLEDGDEVITSPFTFFATAGAIVNAGGRAVFADIDPRTFALDPEAVEAAITDRTRAIVPVHLFGQMAEMQPILEIAARRGIHVVEDAAQAIGAKALVQGQWRSAGAIGALGCLSFYPTKNLGAWGDGGMVTTNDEVMAERLRRLRVHGENYDRGRYVHDEVGTNSRLDAIQAAVLQVKLHHLPGWTETRRARAAWYDQRLASIDEVATPVTEHDRLHIYSLYTIRAQERDALKDHLAQHGVGTGIYYPLPLHLQPCFSDLGHQRGEFPQAERAAAEVLSLPLYPELTPEEMERVAVAIGGFYAA